MTLPPHGLCAGMQALCRNGMRTAGEGAMAELDRKTIYRDFREAVNMSAADLHAWLQSEESRKVGWKGKDGSAGESVGHVSGRKIVLLLRKKKNELDDEDYRHMRKVVGYVRRHLAQRPANTVTSPWRYSLMNWGHDPLQ
jgi:hypothetical protein